MSTSDLIDLATLDAVGALEESERPKYLARLAAATEPERAEIARIYEAAAAVAEVEATTPTPGLKARLAAAVASSGGMFSLRAGEGEWQSVAPGVQVKTLHVDRERHAAVLLARMRAGAVYPKHHHSGPEDCYVVSGEVLVQGDRLAPGDFHHAESGSAHDAVVCVSDSELILVVDAGDYIGS